MGTHALLSASSSHRWLNCPPSARLCEKYEDTGSEYAKEGTDAHNLCEYKLKQALGMDAADPTENLSFYNEVERYNKTVHPRKDEIGGEVWKWDKNTVRNIKQMY